MGGVTAVCGKEEACFHGDDVCAYTHNSNCPSLEVQEL